MRIRNFSDIQKYAILNNNHFNTFQPLISYGQGPLTRRCRTRVKVNTLLKGQIRVGQIL